MPGSDPHADDVAPRETGVSLVDPETGKSRLIVSHHRLATTGEVIRNEKESRHHVYHLLYSPNGGRFIMLHLWTQWQGGHLTRLCTAATAGSCI